MTSAKPGGGSTADMVRASVIRRPTGAATPVRAAATFQGADAAAGAEAMMRTTLQLAPSLRTALKRLALDADTTMSGLIRAAIAAAMESPDELAAASMEHRRVSAGARTTLDLPRELHRSLKRLAADRDTSVQALVIAAIARTHPNMT
jgi:predicted transcriptional regulator